MMYTVGHKTGPLCFTACNFRSIDHHIGTTFGTNPRYFILNITSKLSNPDMDLTAQIMLKIFSKYSIKK